jgi:hypothetical protein
MMVGHISSCAVTECAYNTDKMCHAKAITVGDGVHAMCDTYFKASVHGGIKDQTGEVGACKVSACRFNTDLECQANSIQVSYHKDHPDCITFARR